MLYSHIADVLFCAFPVRLRGYSLGEISFSDKKTNLKVMYGNYKIKS